VRTSAAKNGTERRGFLFSLWLHVFLLYGIVFAFTPRAVAHKPIMTFLGAILENQDFAGLLANTDRKANPQGSDLLSIQVAATQSQFYPLQTTHVPKPVFSQQVKDAPRKYVKSDFLKDTSPTEKSGATLQDLGVDPEAPPRPSLRLSWP